MSETSYTKLKPLQKKFIHHLVDVAGLNKEIVDRRTLDMHSLNYGYAYAPAWIVKDLTRRVDRGVWRIPEIEDYVVEKACDVILQEA